MTQSAALKDREAAFAARPALACAGAASSLVLKQCAVPRLRAHAHASVMLLLASAASPASADGGAPVQEALERQQRQLRGALGIDCSQIAAPGEIVVCGKRGRSPYRLPEGSASEPRARGIGEPADQRETMALNPERCPAARARPQSRGLDLVAIAVTAASMAATVAGASSLAAKPRPPKLCH